MQEPRTVRETVPLHPQVSGSSRTPLTKKEEVNDEEGRVRRR